MFLEDEWDTQSYMIKLVLLYPDSMAFLIPLVRFHSYENEFKPKQNHTVPGNPFFM